MPVLPDPDVAPLTSRLVCGVAVAGQLDGEPVLWDGAGQPWIYEQAGIPGVCKNWTEDRSLLEPLSRRSRRG